MNHKLAAEVWFPRREIHADLVLNIPLRYISKEHSAAHLVPFSIFSAFLLLLLGYLGRMDCCGRSAIYREAQDAAADLMTRKHSTHRKAHEREALFPDVGASGLLKHNRHPYAIRLKGGRISKSYSHQKHFLRSFLTRALALVRPEEERAGVGLVRVGGGTSYSPSKASITPWKRPSCCRKSCSTL